MCGKISLQTGFILPGLPEQPFAVGGALQDEGQSVGDDDDRRLRFRGRLFIVAVGRPKVRGGAPEQGVQGCGGGTGAIKDTG